ncbi:hypothetical protein V6R21_32220 [Limibacter armeniacum]|uniref:hypothetical protein n=1 Tax=Limibacter armeniacum TaxID=466084 RepID=UPI002FE5CDE4
MRTILILTITLIFSTCLYAQKGTTLIGDFKAGMSKKEYRSAIKEVPVSAFFHRMKFNGIEFIVNGTNKAYGAGEKELKTFTMYSALDHDATEAALFKLMSLFKNELKYEVVYEKEYAKSPALSKGDLMACYNDINGNRVFTITMGGTSYTSGVLFYYMYLDIESKKDFDLKLKDSKVDHNKDVNDAKKMLSGN